MILVLALLLFGCKSSGEIEAANGDKLPVLMNVYRYEDNEAGVACWVFSGYYKGGIDCLPISETKLGE